MGGRPHAPPAATLAQPYWEHDGGEGEREEELPRNWKHKNRRLVPLVSLVRRLKEFRGGKGRGPVGVAALVVRKTGAEISIISTLRPKEAEEEDERESKK